MRAYPVIPFLKGQSALLKGWYLIAVSGGDYKKAPLSFDNVDKNAVKATLYDAVKDGRMVLLSSEAASLVKAYGIPATPIKLAKTASQASKIAEEIGYPVVLKVASLKFYIKQTSAECK